MPVPLLILGLILFLGMHALSMARGRRAALIARFGEGAYKGLYSLVSVVGIILVIVGFGQYREGGYIQVWDPPVWTRHLALILVWLAFICIAATYLPGRIKARLKHPMLAGVKLWAVAHLLANGDLGSMLLFGSFLIWAVLARISAKRRDEGPPHGAPHGFPGGFRNDALAIMIGTVAYGAFVLWLHPLLIGVAVLPTQG
ncbi:MAG: NnrU family protein [Microvirga sp.]|jgi:uncharacterized membrane protein|nr:NnrU family protein [Microvirga sp.]